MSPERYFKWCIWSPVLVPAVWVIMVTVAGALGMSPAVGGFGGFVFGYTLIGGVPYLVFATILTWALRHAQLRKLKLAAFCAPLLFTAFLFVIVAAVSFPDLSEFGFAQSFFPALYYAAWAVGVGYAYVAIVYAIFFALHRFGAFNASQKAA